MTMDEAFERYRAKKFGAWAEYPLDAYTHFCAGWKAAEDEADIDAAVEALAEAEDDGTTSLDALKRELSE